MRQEKAATLSRRRDPLWEKRRELQTASRLEPALALRNQRSTLNPERPLPNHQNIAGCLCETPLLGWRLTQTLYNYLPAAIRFSASLTKSSADCASPFCCKSRTALWASTCLY